MRNSPPHWRHGSPAPMEMAIAAPQTLEANSVGVIVIVNVPRRYPLEPDSRPKGNWLAGLVIRAAEKQGLTVALLLLGTTWAVKRRDAVVAFAHAYPSDAAGLAILLVFSALGIWGVGTAAVRRFHAKPFAYTDWTKGRLPKFGIRAKWAYTDDKPPRAHSVALCPTCSAELAIAMIEEARPPERRAVTNISCVNACYYSTFPGTPDGLQATLDTEIIRMVDAGDWRPALIAEMRMEARKTSISIPALNDPRELVRHLKRLERERKKRA